MNETQKRAIISGVIFIAVHVGARAFDIPTYDDLIKTFVFMSSIIAAGCYWIGSNSGK